MTSVVSGLRHLAGWRQLTRASWYQTVKLRVGESDRSRAVSTESFTGAHATDSYKKPEGVAQIPFRDVRFARAVPQMPSYFSREPQFNDLHVLISRLLAEYQHLPMVSPGDAPQVPWIKLKDMRSKLGESIKASHYAMVMQVAKRLNRIEPSLVPSKVSRALRGFIRDIDPNLNKPNPVQIDKLGRAIAVGKRKEATARAFLVEGTGEVLVNGKTLDEAFGRVHDRESAVWALKATKRLDKYNLWALVEGGGTTGQAEALTLAVGKALVAHEPALKPALRKGIRERLRGKSTAISRLGKWVLGLNVKQHGQTSNADEEKMVIRVMAPKILVQQLAFGIPKGPKSTQGK